MDSPEESTVEKAIDLPRKLDVTVPPSPNRPPHKVPDFIGPYRILELLGEGGMGIVYKAEQREPVRRVVALKVIKLGMDTREVIARFEAERQALALMSHQNVAKVFDAGMTDAGRPFFAMELVPGVPMTVYCDAEKLTLRQRLELFVPVCQAIQHAHQKGIIHRDLKPGNVLVQFIDSKAVPKVIDFGVAKATNQALAQHTLFTRTGTLIGTPEYISPEQACSGGLDVDTRTDVYSLGVILFELLTGTLPYDARTLRSAGPEGIAKILKETDPPRPSTKLAPTGRATDQDLDANLVRIAKARGSEVDTLRRDLRGDLDWVILKAMEKERSRRYETANALAMDVQRFLDDEPVLARSASRSYRMRKFIRKHKGEAVAIASVTTALLMGIVGTTTFAFRATLASRAAQQSNRNALASEAAALKAKGEADRERDQAQAVNTFISNMLLSMSLERAGSTTISIQQVLDKAVADLDSGVLKHQPAVEAEIRRKLAGLYATSSLYPQSLSQARKAVDLLQPLYPAGSASLGRCLVTLGNALQTQGDGRAETVLTGALAMQRHYCPPVSEDLAEALTALGYYYRGKPGSGLPLMQEALQIRQQLGDPDDIATSLINVGNVYFNAMDYARAEAMNDRAIAIYRKAHGNAHPFVATALSNGGYLLIRQGKYQEAREKFSEALALHEQLVGLNSAAALNDLAGLSSALFRMKDYPQAESILRKLYDRTLQVYGQEHPENLAYIVSELLPTLLAEGKFADAEALAAEMRRRLVDAGQFTTPRQQSLAESMVVGYRTVGRRNEAAVWERALIEALQHAILESSDRIRANAADFQAYLDRGVDLARLGRFEEALSDFDQAKKLKPDDHAAWMYEAYLLAYLGRQKQYQQTAEAMFQRFGGTSDPSILNRTDKVCLVLRGGGEPRKLLGSIDHEAVLASSNGNLPDWAYLNLALGNYRVANYQMCIQNAQKCAATAYPMRAATADLLVAMARQRLGDQASALDSLHAAQNLLDQLAKPSDPELGADGVIEDWLICQVILREAGEVLGIGAKPGPASK